MMYEHETTKEIMGLEHPCLVLYSTERDFNGCPVLTIESVEVAGHASLPHFDSTGAYLGYYPNSLDVLPILGAAQVAELLEEIEEHIREQNDAAMAAELY